MLSSSRRRRDSSKQDSKRKELKEPNLAVKMSIGVSRTRIVGVIIVLVLEIVVNGPRSSLEDTAGPRGAAVVDGWDGLEWNGGRLAMVG